MPDQMVGIYVERSIEMMVGLLGILKAGAAYVPMDPSYPAERIALMLEDSRARVVVTTTNLAGSLPPHTRALCIDAGGEAGEADRPHVAMTGENLAYVIFTSGSTGRPKGVMLEHRNVANFFDSHGSGVGDGARRVARDHQHLVRHFGIGAVLDAGARLYGGHPA